ncbi:MAG TPA: hypothetical protein VLQ79_06505, partial [Myxococcaceae bacterium]|nr:hypothetical protein [Myxococcaceae bacterium]
LPAQKAVSLSYVTLGSADGGFEVVFSCTVPPAQPQLCAARWTNAGWETASVVAAPFFSRELLGTQRGGPPRVFVDSSTLFTRDGGVWERLDLPAALLGNGELILQTGYLEDGRLFFNAGGLLYEESRGR